MKFNNRIPIELDGLVVKLFGSIGNLDEATKGCCGDRATADEELTEFGYLGHCGQTWLLNSQFIDGCRDREESDGKERCLTRSVTNVFAPKGFRLALYQSWLTTVELVAVLPLLTDSINCRASA